MAKYSNIVSYDIKTTLDTSGITKLQSELNKVQTTLNNLAASPSKRKSLGLNFDEIQLYQTQVEELGRTISQCFNSRTGMLNINQFNKAIKTGTLDVADLNGAFRAAGNQGKTAFNSLITMMTNVNKQAITVNSTMSKIATTFSNTVRWGITASIFQEMMSSVQGAVSYMKDLDESLTQIQMVTNSSKENMRELAQYANNAAQALGSTTTDYTNAVKVFVQEGFSERESQQYANLSTKLANVSEQNTQTTSDQITAYRNAFQLDYKQTAEAMDKIANVANHTASNVNELMTASQRAASVAQAVGSSQDSFLASIATIESVTRQSAEEIGNGLKAIYQRFADIKVSGSTEDGVDYGQYAQALKAVGVDVLDAAGEFKGMDQIFEELQAVWSELSDTMKIAVGEKVAGKFQYNRFAALMNNPEYYQKSLSATQGATGMMDQMNDIYIDSIEGRLNTLRAASEQVMSSLFDQDVVEPIIGDITEVVNGLNAIVEVAGGGVPVFTAFSAILLKAFSPQIASQVTQIATNIATMTQASNNMKNMEEAMMMAGQMGRGLGSKTYDVASRGMTSVAGLSQASQEKMTVLVQQMSEAEDKIVLAEDNINNLATQLATKYQQRLSLTEENARVFEEYIALEIKNGTLTQQQLQAFGEEIGLEEKQVELIKLTRSEANEAARSLREMNAATEGIDINLRAANTAIEGFKTEQVARGFAQALSAVTSLAFGIQSITSLLSILNNESASFEEKINAILISGTMIISTFASMATSIKSGFEAIATGLGFTERAAALAAETAAQEAYNKAVIENVAAQEQLNIIKIIGTEEDIAAAEAEVARTMAVKADTEAIYEETLATVTNTGATEANSTATLANVAAKAKETLTTKVKVAATTEGTIANKLYSISEKALAAAGVEATAATAGLGRTLAMIAGPVGLAVAAIGGAVVAYQAWQHHIHAASEEFENQKELLSQTKKAYSDAAEEVETLKNSLDSIGKSRSSLNDLTEGTDEWREAVRKLNDEILTLLQTYPELAQYVTNKDGVLALDEAGVNQFYQKQLGEASHLADVNFIQQANTLQAQNAKLIEDFSNQWGGLSRDDFEEEVKIALQDGTVTFSSDDNLNAAFVELKNSVETNSLAITNLTDNVGTLNTTYRDYSSGHGEGLSESQVQMAHQSIINKYGNYSLWGYGDINDDSFLEAVNEATPWGVTNAKGEGENITFKTVSGEEETHTRAEILDLLTRNQIALDLANQRLVENIDIYKQFGAVYNDVTKQFEDSSGNVINSLTDLSGVTEEQAAIIEKMADSNYRTYMEGLYGSAGDFAQYVKNNEFANSTQLADQEAALDAYLNNESFREGLSPYIHNLEEFTAAVKQGAIDVEGLSTALNELTSETVDLTTNFNGNLFTNRIDFDEENFDDFLKEQDISKGAFNRMARDMSEEEGGYFIEEKKALEELIDAKQADGVITEEEAEEIEKLNSKIEGLDDSAKDTAAMILRMSNGVVKLRNNIDDISEILTSDAARGTSEWYEALDDLDEGLSEVLNIDAGTLSDSFIESGDALAYAQRMAEGDMTAIDDLRVAASQDIIQNLNIQVDPDQDVEVVRSELMFELQQLQADIDSGAITVTTDLDKDPFIQKLDELLAESAITEEQASAILSSVGMEANIKHAKGDGSVQAIEYVPTLTADAMAVDMGPLGSFQMPGVKMVPNLVDIPTEIDIPYLEGAHYTGPGVTTANTAASNPSYTGGYSGNPKKSGGSGGKSPKSSTPKNNQKKEKQKSEWDYLTDITNDIDRATDVMEKMARLEDRLYGKDRITQMKKLQGEYQKNIKLHQQELKLEQKHAKILRTKAKDENGNPTINAYAKLAGFKSIQFDAQGNLENGEAIEKALLGRVNKATANYNKHRNDDDPKKYEWELEQAKNSYDGFMKAMSEYEATLGKIEDSQDAIQEYKEKMQDTTDAIIDAIQEGVEDIIKASNNQREFNKLSRDWRQGGSGYSHFGNARQYYVEGLQGLLSPTIKGKSVFDLQTKNLQDRYSDAQQVFSSKKNPDDRKLSEQQAYENLQQATTDILGSLQDAISYYDSLLDTVDETSKKMDELIDSRLGEFDNLEDFLDTRLDQIKLLFGDRSYNKQTELYNKKIETNMEKMISINTAIEAKQATVESLKALEAKGTELSTEQRQTLKDAQDKVNELQQEQLSTETQLLTDIADRLRTQTSAEMNNAIKQIFGGADVDWLSQQWELAARNSEKYFDDYNRAFELQKLQLKFQEALNDSQSTSLATQQKIVALGDEYLTYLREKKNLSEYDVKHAQLELDILQKKIALEEARNNKSQMRLQRNAAGNYDFVYGADENAVAKANEALIAAQQESYNLSKQMYLDTYQSAFDAAIKTRDMVIEIATDASIGIEERTERIKFVIDNLGEYLDGSSVELSETSINLYNSFVEAEQMIADENLGGLEEVFDIMREESGATNSALSEQSDALSQTISNNVDAIAEKTSTGLIDIRQKITDTMTGITTDVSSTRENIEEEVGQIKSTTDGILTDIGMAIDDATPEYEKKISDSLTRIKVGTTESSGGLAGLPTAVKEVLETIDGDFKLSTTNIIAGVDNIDATLSSAYGKITDKDNGYLAQFKEATEAALASAGDSYDNFVEKNLEKVDEKLGELRGTSQAWKSDLDMLNNTIKTCATEIETWKRKIDAAISSAEDLIKKASTLEGKLAAQGAGAAYAADRYDTLGSSAQSLGSSIATMGGDIESAYSSVESAAASAQTAIENMGRAAQAAGQAYKDMNGSAGEAKKGTLDLAEMVKQTVKGLSESVAYMKQVVDSVDRGVNAQVTYTWTDHGMVGSDGSYTDEWKTYTQFEDWVLKYPGLYDTGGYTGTWNDGDQRVKDGKWAVLHQKELVLNAEDTENILSAVGVVRDIMNGINSLPSIGRGVVGSSLSNSVDQRVEINATFPGVTEAVEIKQALEQLADNAYQEARRYKY